MAGIIYYGPRDEFSYESVRGRLAVARKKVPCKDVKGGANLDPLITLLSMPGLPSNVTIYFETPAPAPTDNHIILFGLPVPAKRFNLFLLF